MAEPEVALEAAATEQRIFVASQWQLMWWRFRKHKVAVASAFVVALCSLSTMSFGVPAGATIANHAVML